MESRAVLFYDGDAVRIRETGRASCVALDQGDAAIRSAVVAHHQQLERQLIDRGIDVDEACERRQYAAPDAVETLGRSCVDGLPDVERFAAEIATEALASPHGMQAFAKVCA